MARVNSYIGKGSGTYHGADKDLHEEVTEEPAMKHRVAVTVSDPNHTAVSKRKEQVQKFVKVTATSEADALKKASAHFKKAGFKIHRAEHHSMVEEELQELSSDKLAQYKKAAGADASAADKAGNYARGNKRFRGIIKATNKQFDNDMKNVKEGDVSHLPRVSKDKESGLPKKYVAGLSASTAKARAAHFAKADKLSDSDPRAYKPAPGDATAKTKLSKYTIKSREMFGEEMDEEILEACWVGYKQVGVKKKGDRMVPNCVPEAANPAQQAAIAIAMKKDGKKPKNEEASGAGEEGTDSLRKKYTKDTPGQHVETLNIKKTDMGDVIKDFQSSDAPQFRGKSLKKIRQMAIAAKLSSQDKE
jgi:hypothetical protein